MKVAHIGSNSVHVSHFVAALQVHNVTNVLIAEETCCFEGVDNDLVVSYRKLSPNIFRKNKAIIKAFLLKEQPDVLHIHQLNRLAYFVSKIAKSLKIPIIGTAWGSDVLIVPSKNWIVSRIVKLTIKRCFMVTADAEIMIEAMSKMVSTKVQFQKIQYGIDPVDSILPKEKIIFSNRVVQPLYRIDQIVRYFAEAVSNFPDYKLVIAAFGSETDNIKELANELGIEKNVEFVGWLTSNQNRSWYAKSAFYISIPESDGTSVSLLEAISAACIPIVSNLPANREWVIDGVNGVIENGNENPISKALSIDLSENIPTNIEKVNRIASRTSTIPQFISFYEQCISK